MLSQSYYEDFAVAFIRGRALQGSPEELATASMPGHFGANDNITDATRQMVPGQPPAWATIPFSALSSEQKQAILGLGQSQGLRLHKFKRTQPLARVSKILGLLKGMMPRSLLDIGSGRGTFLWPLLDQFPFVPVTACDHSEQRYQDLTAVSRGGIRNLEVVSDDATDLPFDDQSFDVVTALEVLEHIPNFQQAIAEIVRCAKRFVLISVPSKEDENPEHLRLLTKLLISKSLQALGMNKVSFLSVLNHLIAVVNVETDSQEHNA